MWENEYQVVALEVTRAGWRASNPCPRNGPTIWIPTGSPSEAKPIGALVAGSRYRGENEDVPPGWFTRATAAVIRALGIVFVAVRWLFWALLWLPTQFFQRFYGAIAAVYPGLLRWSLRHRLAVVVSAALIFAGTMALIIVLVLGFIGWFLWAAAGAEAGAVTERQTHKAKQHEKRCNALQGK